MAFQMPTTYTLDKTYRLDNDERIARALVLFRRAHEISDKYADLLAILEEQVADMYDPNEITYASKNLPDQVLEKADQLVGDLYFRFAQINSYVRVIQTKDGILVGDKLYTRYDDKIMDGDRHVYTVSIMFRCIGFGPDA